MESGWNISENLRIAFNFLLHPEKTWLIPLAGFVIIGAIACLVFNRGQSHSFKSLVKYIFPRELYRNPTSRVDKWHFLLTFLIWLPLHNIFHVVVLAIVGIDLSLFLNNHLGQRPLMIESVPILLSLQVAVAVLGTALGDYIQHYLFHKIPFLWSIHRAHHSAEALTLFTSRRGHPIEDVVSFPIMAGTSGVCTGLLLYLTGTELLPATPVVVASIGFYFIVLLHFQHSHIPVSFGIFNRILTSPVMHQIHHSAEPRHRDKNFGVFISVFDWIFGTQYIPKRGEVYRWGINEQELGQHNPHLKVSDFYLEPLVHSWRCLVGLLKRCVSAGPDGRTKAV